MSAKLIQLRAQRDAKAKEAHAINNKYSADVRMTGADASALDALLNEVESIDAEIARENRLVAAAFDGDEAAQQDIALNAAVQAGRGNSQSDESRAMRAFLSGGIAHMQAEDRARMAARQTPDIRNAMSTTTNSEGGFTVAIEYYRELEIAMKAYGGMRQAAKVIRTATGATMNFPTTDPTAEEGEIVGQNTTATLGETTFANIALDVYKYSSKRIALPFELIQDSFIDIESYVRTLLAMRLGRITNKHYQIGTGTGQPRGLSVAATTGRTGTSGQTTSVTYDDLVFLEHSVDPVYRAMPDCGYIMNDATLGAIRRIKDTQGRPIFVPGYEVGVHGGAPDRLLGRPITIDQYMPVMAANAKSIGFGHLSQYVIRDVMDLTLFRMTDSAFTLLGQVGFVAFMRTGGNFIDVGGAVKFYANSAT
ncbi:MAG: phage major capsid protein [Rhodocyclaceae bacterium]|nr:phage major capsid protein [Rhodocyclaceae bacterium]